MSIEHSPYLSGSVLSCLSNICIPFISHSFFLPILFSCLQIPSPVFPLQPRPSSLNSRPILPKPNLLPGNQTLLQRPSNTHRHNSHFQPKWRRRIIKTTGRKLIRLCNKRISEPSIIMRWNLPANARRGVKLNFGSAKHEKDPALQISEAGFHFRILESSDPRAVRPQ